MNVSNSMVDSLKHLLINKYDYVDNDYDREFKEKFHPFKEYNMFINKTDGNI